MKSRLDHIVVAASRLEEGKQYIREMLDLDIPIGGRHDMMGTHNCVMALGERTYLEVVAVNSRMSPPECPRWFGLDDPYIRMALKQGPRLLTWAVNTTDLEALVNASGTPLGCIKEAQRDNLKWKVALSEDGRMPGAGFLPLCIQWQVSSHPAGHMADFGWRLETLAVYHNRKIWMEKMLESIGAREEVGLVEIEDGHLSFMEVKLTRSGRTIILSSLP